MIGYSTNWIAKSHLILWTIHINCWLVFCPKVWIAAAFPAPVLIKSGIDSAVAIAKRIFDKLKNENIPHEENPPHNYLSVSIGLISSEDLKDLENTFSKQVVEKADKALYHAKDSGRNTFVKFSQISWKK